MEVYFPESQNSDRSLVIQEACESKKKKKNSEKRDRFNVYRHIQITQELMEIIQP